MNLLHPKGVFNNHLHNLMNKEYYADFLKFEVDHKTSLNPAPLI